MPWNIATREGIYPSCGRTLTARQDGSPCIDRGQEVIVEKCGAFLPLAGDKAGSVAYTENGSPTLRAESPTACVVGIDIYNAAFNQGENAKYEFDVSDNGISQTLVARDPNAVVYCLQGNGIDRADTAGCNGCGWRENVCYTLNTIDRPAVCYNTIKNEDTTPQYIIRRLTPLECGRLQGMPDWYVADIPHSDANEYKLWGNGMALPNALYIMEGVIDFD